MGGTRSGGYATILMAQNSGGSHTQRVIPQWAKGERVCPGSRVDQRAGGTEVRVRICCSRAMVINWERVVAQSLRCRFFR